MGSEKNLNEETHHEVGFVKFQRGEIRRYCFGWSYPKRITEHPTVKTTNQNLIYKCNKVSMRKRSKVCFKCNEPKEVLYRCRYVDLKDWVFLCDPCLKQIKETYSDTYRYGGTWKSKKK